MLSFRKSLVGWKPEAGITCWGETTKVLRNFFWSKFRTEEHSIIMFTSSPNLSLIFERMRELLKTTHSVKFAVSGLAGATRCTNHEEIWHTKGKVFRAKFLSIREEDGYGSHKIQKDVCISRRFWFCNDFASLTISSRQSCSLYWSSK